MDKQSRFVTSRLFVNAFRTRADKPTRGEEGAD
jgi:hypothetical protein